MLAPQHQGSTLHCRAAFCMSDAKPPQPRTAALGTGLRKQSPGSIDHHPDSSRLTVSHQRASKPKNTATKILDSLKALRHSRSPGNHKRNTIAREESTPLPGHIQLKSFDRHSERVLDASMLITRKEDGRPHARCTRHIATPSRMLSGEGTLPTPKAVDQKRGYDDTVCK